MFDNIGNKIKTLAKVVCFIGIVSSLITGIVLGNLLSSGVGLVIIILGCLLSWIGSFFTYGFGELIEKTTEIANNTRQTSMTSPKSSISEDTLDTSENQQQQELTIEEEDNDDGEELPSDAQL